MYTVYVLYAQKVRYTTATIPTCGVIEDGADVDLDVAPPGDGLPEEAADVLALDAGAAEPLGPLHQVRLGQSLLQCIQLMILVQSPEFKFRFVFFPLQMLRFSAL